MPQLDIFTGKEIVEKDNSEPEVNLLAHLSDTIGKPIYYKGLWIVGMGEGHYATGKGKRGGLNSRPQLKAFSPDTEDSFLLLGLVRKAVPQLIGRALMGNQAIEVIKAEGLRLTVSGFGITGEARPVVLEKVGEKWTVVQ